MVRPMLNKRKVGNPEPIDDDRPTRRGRCRMWTARAKGEPALVLPPTFRAPAIVAPGECLIQAHRSLSYLPPPCPRSPIDADLIAKPCSFPPSFRESIAQPRFLACAGPTASNFGEMPADWSTIRDRGRRCPSPMEIPRSTHIHYPKPRLANDIRTPAAIMKRRKCVPCDSLPEGTGLLIAW